MSFRSSLALFKVPSLAPTMLALLLAVLAEAVAGSYTALLAIEKIGMSPLEVTAFLMLSAIAGIVGATFLGGLYDRKPGLWPLYATMAAKIVGYALAGIVTAPWMLIVVGVTLLGFGSASFALLFAIAKAQLDRTDETTSSRGMAAMRLLTSLGWAIGPAIGAALVALGSFTAVYLGAATLALIGLATVLLTRLDVVPAAIGARRVLDLGVVRLAAPAALALTLFHTTMFMGSTAMAVVVVRELGTPTDVGLMFSLCAALEVLVIAIFIVRPMKKVSHGLLIAGFVIFALYFAAPLLFPTLFAFYVAQVLRAVAIAIISILGMAYIQELLPGRPGAAAALFSNTMSTGALVSGLGSGLWAGTFGFWSIFDVSVVLSLVAAAAIALGRPAAKTATD